jgi:hypothetical protein
MARYRFAVRLIGRWRVIGSAAAKLREVLSGAG